MDYSMLLSPMKIGNLEIKNRTVMTAAEFSMGQANGKPTEKLMDYYEERAKGGVGLIIPVLRSLSTRRKLRKNMVKQQIQGYLFNKSTKYGERRCA